MSKYDLESAPIFEGTKQLRASPMTKDEYCEFRGWPVPDGEDPFEAGWCVMYLDGGKPNLDGYPGYVSWSPADVFERTYRRVELTFVDRLQGEIIQLDDRLGKLGEFIGTDTFNALEDVDRELLYQQQRWMIGYRETVALRYDRAKAAEEGAAHEPEENQADHEPPVSVASEGLIDQGGHSV